MCSIRPAGADFPKRARTGVNALLHTVALQIILGISTLLMAVPVLLGAAHQAVALLLFSVALFTTHALRSAE